MNRNLAVAAFVLGLVAVLWVGAGYAASSHPLALLMTAAIAGVYLLGAWELRRFHQATSGLRQAVAAVAAVPVPLTQLDEWMARLHHSLQAPVRQRLEGARVALPGPALTPTLVGLLVMLGMLGTFLGMVVTLNGAVLALESTTDLATIRAALSAPVKGLGLAFGTSVAGVAASAMLGLMSAACRRERLQATQALDCCIAGPLRSFTESHRRAQMSEVLQSQARVVPEAVAQLQATLQTLVTQMERQSDAQSERLLARQEDFFRHSQQVLTGLATSVDQSLQRSLAEAARLTGATVQPLAEAMLAGIAREARQLHERVADSVAQQLDRVSTRLDQSTSAMEATWAGALAKHEQTSDALAQRQQQGLDGLAQGFEQRMTHLLTTLEQAQVAGQAALLDTVTQQSATLREDAARQATELLARLEAAQAKQQADRAAHDEARQAALVQSQQALATSLMQQWSAAGAATAEHQQRICETLEATAVRMQAQAEAHACATIGEIAQLTHTAAEAPRLAADLLGQLRQQLSDSLLRDTDLLTERQHIMDTLRTLLDAIQHAATEQRTAIDALVESSSALLQRVGGELSERVTTEVSRLAEVATQVTGSALEIGSLGEAFGAGVQRFGDATESLIGTLQRIESSLDRSTTRSDEQLAYYVAQAREIIDLSMLSQQQLVEDLQQLQRRQASMAESS